jgi:hypothetical protein
MQFRIEQEVTKVNKKSAQDRNTPEDIKPPKNGDIAIAEAFVRR